MKIDKSLIFGRMAVSGMIILMLLGSVMGYTIIGTDISVEGILYANTINERTSGGVTIEGIKHDASEITLLTEKAIMFSDANWAIKRETAPAGAQIVTTAALVSVVYGASNQGYMVKNNFGASCFEVAGDGDAYLLKDFEMGGVLKTDTINEHGLNSGVSISRLVIDTQSAQPSAPVEGQIYIDTDDNILYWYVNGAWRS